MSLVMVHADVDAPAEVVSEKVYKRVWAKRGWTLLGAPESYATRFLGRKVTKLSDLKSDELDRLARSRRVKPGGTKAESQAAFTATFAEPAKAEPAPAPPATPPADNQLQAPAATDKNKENTQ